MRSFNMLVAMCLVAVAAAEAGAIYKRRLPTNYNPVVAFPTKNSVGKDKPELNVEPELARSLQTWEGFIRAIGSPLELNNHMSGVMQRSSQWSPNANEPLTLRTRIGGLTAAPVQNRNGGMAQPAGCEPQLTEVPLQDPQKLYVYWPSCTRVERCGGCCLSDQLQCRPTKTETIHLQVVRAEYYGSNSSAIKYLGTDMVPTEVHTACECGCKRDQKSCNMYQKFDEYDCTCRCANIDDRDKCLRKLDRFWDSTSCKCVCREEKQCSSGHFFDINRCSCRRRQSLPDMDDATAAFFNHFGSFYPTGDDNSDNSGASRDNRRRQFQSQFDSQTARHAEPIKVEPVKRAEPKVRGKIHVDRYESLNRG